MAVIKVVVSVLMNAVVPIKILCNWLKKDKLP